MMSADTLYWMQKVPRRVRPLMEFFFAAEDTREKDSFQTVIESRLQSRTSPSDPLEAPEDVLDIQSENDRTAVWAGVGVRTAK